MTTAYVILVVIAAAALAYIVLPLRASEASGSDPLSATLDEARDLRSRHDMVLGALRDLEDDRAMDKIDESDHKQLQARLQARAVDLMKRIDREAQQRKNASRPGPRRLPRNESDSADS
jgi:hypothetical protein